ALPARALAPSMNTIQLADRLRTMLAASGCAPTPPPQYDDGVQPSPAVIHEMPDAGGSGPGIWRELRAVLRLLLVRAVNGADLVGRDVTLATLAAILLAVWMPLDLLVFPGDLEFNVYALVSIGWIAAGVLGLAWLLSRLSQPRVPYRRTLLLATGALPLAIV